MCDVTVGKLLKHNGDGFGFKITFSDEAVALQWKMILGNVLLKSFNDGDVIIDNGGYYDKI
jgi:hypothetical protein